MPTSNVIYIETPTPYLNVEVSAPVILPLRVRLTFGAISLIMQALVTPSLPTFALRTPTLPSPLYEPPIAATSNGFALECVVDDASERSPLTLYSRPTLADDSLADVTDAKRGPDEYDAPRLYPETPALSPERLYPRLPPTLIPGETPTQALVENLLMFSTSRDPVVVTPPRVYSSPRSAPLLALKVTLQPGQGEMDDSRTLDPSGLAWSLSKFNPA